MGLVEDLSRPTAYPGPRPRGVRLVTTHISWVFVTDDAAWKVRRPVDLGFVDFTSREARRADCEAEVRLNRRLAPGIYEAVVPIHMTAAGHSFCGPGPVVDHAVKMRRLPDDRSAAALLRGGGLNAQHLQQLAAHMARFYAAAAPAPAFGTAAAMERNLEENLTQLAALPWDPGSAAQLAEVAAAQRRDLRRLGPLFADRLRAGKSRDGHGDLRLEHVYFLGDGQDPLVIDCVEFAERFRAGDIALDVAFFAMELAAGGRDELAEYFLYRFARDSSDFGQYQLMDFFLTYRALVRSKIAGMLGGDARTPADKAAAKRAEAHALLQLAVRFAGGPRRPPCLIAVGGLVGAGKSHIAETLARRLGLPVIGSDVARKQLAGQEPLAPGSPELYTPAHSQRTAAELHRRATLVLGSGRGVILDATFRNAAPRAAARQLAASHGVPFLFIEAACDEATLRERLRARAQARSESDADLAVLGRIRGEFSPPDELPPGEVLRWSSTAPADDLVAALGRTPVSAGTQPQGPARG